MEIKSRNVISKKEKRDLQEELKIRLGDSAPKLSRKSFIIEVARTEDELFYLNNGRIWFFNHQNQLIPSIHCLRSSSLTLPKVVVDVGAIRFITNGADIMAPGVVYFDEKITERTLVAVHEEKAQTVIGVGFSLIDGKDFAKIQKGKVVENIHFLTDRIWEANF